MDGNGWQWIAMEQWITWRRQNDSRYTVAGFCPVVAVSTDDDGKATDDDRNIWEFRLG